MTISSFLFIDEFGTTASQLGIINGGFVIAMLMGRFATLYLCKRYSVRTIFLLCETFVLTSCMLAIGYYFMEGTHTLVEVIMLVGLQVVGFSGLAILTTNNIMLVGGEQKGTATGLYNSLNQALSWFGVLMAQFFYHLGKSSVTIYQYMVVILLFLRAYPKYRKQLEI